MTSSPPFPADADETPAERVRRAIGQAIRDRRELCEVSQKQFAQDVGVTISAVSAWENGDTSPKDIYRKRIAKRLRVSYASLFEHDGTVA